MEKAGESTRYVWYIDLDSAIRYHQVTVKKCEKHILRFSSLDNEMCTFDVMPFGSRNNPTFFTPITRVVHGEAMNLFMLLCNTIAVNLYMEKLLYPDHVVSKLPRTQDYVQSCSEMMLPESKLMKNRDSSHYHLHW